MQNEDQILDDYKVIGLFCVRKSMYNIFVEYLTEIEDLIVSDKPIPTRTAKRFFALLHKEELIVKKIKSKEWRKKEQDFVLTAMTYFKRHKDYLFSGESIQQYKHFDFLQIFHDHEVETKEHNVPYSFKRMISSCIHSYIVLGEFIIVGKTDRQVRDSTIRYFFEIIDDYCNRYLSEKEKEHFTVYKRRVVAAYLTLHIACKDLWDKDKVIPVTIEGKKQHESIFNHFTNEDLYQATRNAFGYKKKT